MAGLLRVLYQGDPIAALEQTQAGQLQLRYDTAVVEQHSSDPILSVTLPVRQAAYEGEPLRAFLDGLLPEESLREHVARRYRLALDDTFGLLRAIGGDCAGAISFVEPADLDRWQSRSGTVQWLDEDALFRLIDELPLRPLGDDPEEGFRISLAGAQSKLALVVGMDGRMGLPVGSTPSTHILKPQSAAMTGSGRAAFPWMVENEAFCLRLAANAGFTSANASLLHVRGVRLLLVERFDRELSETGRAGRLHQEDLCQALGIPPSRKYESDGGPSLNAVVTLLRGISTEPSDALEFLERTAFHVLIGNNDAHGKNTALLHAARGIHLAPMYDAVSTILYPRLTKRLAMTVGGQGQWDQLTARHWWQQLDSTGFSTAAALRRVSSVPDRVAEAWDKTAAEAEAEGFGHPMLATLRDAVSARSPALRDLPGFVGRGRRARR
jgi:serine/threonine-protein kinase HipA